MSEDWSADKYAMQTMVWRMVLDGAVRAAPLAEELERHARLVSREEASFLLILACLARLAGSSDLVT